MKIALASAPFPSSIADGLFWLEKLVKDAADQLAEIVCFPESYLPGYPGMGYQPEDRTTESLQKALKQVCQIAAAYHIAIIIPMDWHSRHEGFRYPESTRWAAQHGAGIVFHPHFVGSNTEGTPLSEWGHKNNHYYEKAMMMRALENNIYFASVNYASKYPDAASAVIAPDGTCLAHEEYGRAGVIVADIDPAKATGLLAKRFKNEFYK